MKKYLIAICLAVAIPFVLMGATCEDICMREAKAHTHYMTFVAPFRSPAQVLNAIAWHNNLQVACASGKSLAILKALATKGSEARQ